jgi:hypothetical protein
VARAGSAIARRKRFQLERLEGRTLLSGLSYSLTTDLSEYQPGQPIVMTFTATNTGSQPTGIAVGPSVDGFDVSESGKPVWESNTGINPVVLVEENASAWSVLVH